MPQPVQASPAKLPRRSKRASTHQLQLLRHVSLALRHCRQDRQRQVAKIDGNPQDPKSRGTLCARGQAGVSFLYDPDRLKQPMIRTGERGSGDDAKRHLDGGARLRRRQAEQDQGRLRAGIGRLLRPHLGRLLVHRLPAAGLGLAQCCQALHVALHQPREEAALITIGRSIGNHEPVDWDQARCIVLIGTHIGEDARNTMMADLANARARGAKVVVVDPRYSSAGMKADHWLPIKPGTDTALLLAWMNVLITEGLYDKAYVDKYTVGFDKLAAHVKTMTPEWAAPITDLSADQIRAVGA